MIAANVKKGYSIGKVAALLDVPVPTIRNWLNNGKVQGVRRTGGGHRWLTREAVLTLLRQRGISKKVMKKVERRGDRRVFSRQGLVRLRAACPKTGRPMGEGEGRLKDVSATGFRVEDLDWGGYFIPGRGSAFSFEVKGGGLKGAAGIGRIAWMRWTGDSPGVSLGVRLQKLARAKQMESWKAYVRGGAN